MIYFLLPIYNEEENIPSLAAQLKSMMPGEEKFFVFSDDGSKDNSVKALGAAFGDLTHIVLGDGNNYGPGKAFNTGFEWILAHSKDANDLVVTIEADCTSDISLLPPMVSINRLGFDLVLASVYAQGGGFDKTSFLRKLLSNVANLFFRFCFDIKVLTLSSFYRVYRVSLLRSIKSKYGTLINENGFICMLEILLKAIRCNARVIEVPVRLNSLNRKGKSKMKIVKTSLTYLRFLLKRGK